MADLFESLIWTDGQINPSGIKTTLYYCQKSQISSFPRPNVAPASASENVNLDGDFTMVGAATFKKLYSTQGKGKVNWETLGEKDCKMFKNKGVFKFPDLNDAGKNMAKQFVNANCVFVVALPHETEFRYVVIGDADYDTMATITGDSGDEPGSAKGLTIEIEAPCTTPLPGYKGELVLEDGTLDCSTGIFTANEGS
jgi:hypothetical protein